MLAEDPLLALEVLGPYMVTTHIRDSLIGMLIGGRRNQPPEYAAALKEQQRFDLERSVEYAKKLGVGVRWRAGNSAAK